MLHNLKDRQQAGREFEKILNDLFKIHNLSPTGPFRIAGEEIDGSFELESETYLLEAKWERKSVSQSDLLVFRSKIEGKSSITRGVFVSVNGYTAECQRAITQGKQPNFFAMNGHDLMAILQEDIQLITYLKIRRRLLAERGSVFATYDEVKEYEEAHQV